MHDGIVMLYLEGWTKQGWFIIHTRCQNGLYVQLYISNVFCCETFHINLETREQGYTAHTFALAPLSGSSLRHRFRQSEGAM